MNRAAALAIPAVLLVAFTPARATAPADPSHDARACLQNNRIWGWRAVNEKTLIVTDLNDQPFLVQLGGGCVGLNDAIVALEFRTWTNLGCLRQGDRVSYRAPALGVMSCFVRNVQPYQPGLNDPGAGRQEHRYDSAGGG
ncbi:MAG TPA: DUF6491 family protein [Micropepsaceae bacterium]